jgi:hypothetical protein
VFETTAFTNARPSRWSRQRPPAASAPGPRSTEAVAAISRPEWRQCRSEGRAAETPEIVPRRSRRERGRRRLLLWASSSHGACWCEPPAFRASSLLAVVASLPCTRWEHVARGALVVPLRSKRKRSAPEIGRFVFPQLRQCPPALSQCRANAEAGGRTWPPLRARSSRHSRSRPPKVPAFAAFRSSASVNVIGSRTLSLFSS